MSLSRRILESAEAQWRKLTSMVIVDDEPLSEVDSARLAAEITARKAARAQNSAVHSIVATVGVGPAAQAARRKAAADRAAKIHGERQKQKVADQAAADAAFAEMKAQAARGGNWGRNAGSNADSGARGTGGAGRAGPGRSAPAPGRSDSQLAEWYQTLGVSPGDDMAKIKSSYRQLMRKYHPDMHAGDAKKQAAANELSMKVTTAYNSLVSYLERK